MQSPITNGLTPCCLSALRLHVLVAGRLAALSRAFVAPTAIPRYSADAASSLKLITRKSNQICTLIVASHKARGRPSKLKVVRHQKGDSPSVFANKGSFPLPISQFRLVKPHLSLIRLQVLPGLEVGLERGIGAPDADPGLDTSVAPGIFGVVAHDYFVGGKFLEQEPVTAAFSWCLAERRLQDA